MRSRLVWLWNALLANRPLAFTLGGVAFVSLLGFSVSGYQRSNQPGFCWSCHEMRYHYNSWRASSHKGVNCEECHAIPGVWGMMQTKFGGLKQVAVHLKEGQRTYGSLVVQAHVPDESCLQCHAEVSEVITYHSLTITHRKHWDRGVHCTICHAKVVHGDRPEVKNTPKMTVCYRCHDGKKASNDCHLCHNALPMFPTATFTPEWAQRHKHEVRSEGGEGGRDCQRCHQKEYCDNCHRTARPHDAEWVSTHGKRAGNGEQCKTCHQTAAEAAARSERVPTNRGDRSTAEWRRTQASEDGTPLRSVPDYKRQGMAFCDDCHRLRRAHELGWVNKHPAAFRAAPGDCQRCHKVSFCDGCHQMYTPHPKNWRDTHAAAAESGTSKCQTCHVSYFCIACHRQTEPASHRSRSDWLATHKRSVKGDLGECATCHTQSFCVACHRQHKPASHDGQWQRLHGGESQRQGAQCAACHQQTFCRRCHGLEIPHPDQWLEQHPAVARTSQESCAKCHTEKFCGNCHRGGKPASHTATWLAQHGKAALRAEGERRKAEEKAKGERGKAKTTTFLPLALRPSPFHAGCQTCHTGSLCNACHRIEMPHPKDWESALHQAAVKRDAAVCSSCHAQQDCLSCHQKKKPASHNAAWRKGHSKASKGNEAKCAVCHGENSCQACHQTDMPHPDDWTMKQHRKVASFKKDSFCFKCHDLKYCKDCHEDAG